MSLDRLTAALSDRYRIERELGAGGMATVYLAQDLKHDRKVALKVLKPELAAVIGADRFVVEIKTTAALQHPHILPLFDSGSADGFLYYVMPYIEGETLRGKLDRETQFGIEEAVRITVAVADALDYAHRHGVIHRDIKPENILMHDGRPIVADFGIALALSAAAGGRMTETGMSLGTPHYMSPEQATADKEITGRSDIYSLGSVLFEMLTGEPPHMGKSAQQIIMKIVSDEARPVTELRKSVPPNVAAAVAKSLEKLPADRFGTAAEFGRALGDPTFVGPGFGPTGTRAMAATRPSARARWQLIAMAALLVAATGAAVAGWIRKPPAPIPTRFRITLTTEPLSPGLVGRDLAISPDGRTIVYSQVIEGRRQLWVKTADRPDPEPLTGTTDGRAPAFSPDGEWVAFTAAGKLRKVPRTGGSAVTLADSVSPGPFSLAWMEGGTLAYAGPTFDLRTVTQDGGQKRVVLSADTLGRYVLGVAGTPGGQTALVVLCNFGCTAAELVAVDVATGARSDLAEDVLKAWSVRDGRVVFVRRDGGVFAAPFDPETRAFRSPPLPVLDGIWTQGAGAAMALAPNGTLLFVPGAASEAGGTPTEALWVTREGRVSPVDSGWVFGRTLNFGMALSPDDRRLALSVFAGGATDIWIKELDRGAFTRLTFDGINVRPVWADGGRSVLYSSRPSIGAGSEDVMRRRADGTGVPETILDATRGVFEVIPLRDTTQMIVRLATPPSRDIYLLRRGPAQGDSALTPLLADPRYQEVSVSLSPDEKWLAYASDESGRYEVYVRPFPDVNSGRWQISRDGGNEPRWAHSGRELFYRSATGPLMAVAIGPGPGFTHGAQTPLFPVKDYFSSVNNITYAVTQDDRRFLFLRSITAGGSDAPTTAILVQHWLTEIAPRLSGQTAEAAP